jgi:membrane associated rhomboid family serine protease
MTFGVQLLLILNIGAFVLEYFLGIRLSNFCALRANWLSHGAFWQLITYQFIHQGIGHLLANMLGLFFLGPETERALGTKRFFILYLFSGVLGGLGWSILSPDYHTCVGASGAVFGILGAYAALYPNRELILIFMPFTPIKAWVFVLILGAYELLHTLGGPGGAVANSAHLGGGIAGYLYATVIARPDILRKIRRKFKSKEKQPVDQNEINRILDKANADGLHTLTRVERALLKQAGKR